MAEIKEYPERTVTCRCIEPITAIPQTIAYITDLKQEPMNKELIGDIHTQVKVIRNTIKKEIAEQCKIEIEPRVYKLLDMADSEIERHNLEKAIDLIVEAYADTALKFYQAKCMGATK